ncbi:MAG: hypothetical protein WCW40_01430 [Bacteroidota bacterium]
MTNKTFPSIAGGIAAAGIIVAVVNAVTRHYYPAPANLSFANMLALELYLAYLPTGAFLLTFVGMALGGFAGGFLATVIDKSHGARNALIVAALFTLFGIAGMLMVTHPLKLWIINLFTYSPFAMVGHRIASSIKK